TGDIQQLLDVLSPDVVLHSDGGGHVSAARRPILGRDKVLRFLAGVLSPEATLEAVWVNGAPGILVRVDGVLDSIGTAAVEEGPDGLVVSEMYVVRNPEKLRRLEATPLARG